MRLALRRPRYPRGLASPLPLHGAPTPRARVRLHESTRRPGRKRHPNPHPGDMKIVSLPGRLARVLPLAACLFALNASAATFTDPIKNGQDPQILAKDGWFYLIQASGASIALYKSQTVSGLATAAKTTIFTPPTGGPGQPASGSGVWAPELHWLDAENRWYLYYSLPPPASDTSGADR